MSKPDSRSGSVTQARPVESRICEPHRDTWTAGACSLLSWTWSHKDHYHTQAEHEVKQCGRQTQWIVRNSSDESLCLWSTYPQCGLLRHMSQKPSFYHCFHNTFMSDTENSNFHSFLRCLKSQIQADYFFRWFQFLVCVIDICDHRKWTIKFLPFERG